MNDPQPIILVQAGFTKNRDVARQPLRRDFAKMLGAWLKDRTGQIWPGRWYRRAAEMLRVDLVAANIKYATTEGVADFHALRVTYITSLARAGIHPAIAQRLARHSTIALTIGTYTKLGMDETAAGLLALPPPPALPK